jgi:hypothetical protein
MKEQQQSTTNNISNGRVKPTQPPILTQDYYGTITNRLSPGIKILLSILCGNRIFLLSATNVFDSGTEEEKLLIVWPLNSQGYPRYNNTYYHSCYS